jgi:site-specific recombinase XerC
VLDVKSVVAMRESSEDDLGVRDVAGFVMMEGEVRRVDVQGMELKKVNEEEREVVMILRL